MSGTQSAAASGIGLAGQIRFLRASSPSVASTYAVKAALKTGWHALICCSVIRPSLKTGRAGLARKPSAEQST
jgi:hypothetical protein